MGRRTLILLDTHVLIWWINGDLDRLSPQARQTLDSAGPGDLALSPISILEIAMLVEHRRLALTIDIRQWIVRISQLVAIKFIPVDNDIAIESITLPVQFHKDPADRIIVATVRHLGIPIMTANEKILTHEHVGVIW